MIEELNNSAERNEAVTGGVEWGNLDDGMDWDAHVERAKQLVGQEEGVCEKNDIDMVAVNEMRDYHEAAEYRKEEAFRSRVKQEKIEREFNEALTSVDELEGYAESDDPRVVRETIQYDGKDITIYRLRGFPMKFLGHMINYRENDSGWGKGRELSDQLMREPALWNRHKASEVAASEKGWNHDGDGLANTLSTSYVDLATGIDSYDHLPKVSNLAVPTGRVMYGISKVRPMSVLFAKHQDGQTSPQLANAGRILYSEVGSIDDLNADNKTNNMYNEVAMLRYDDRGNTVPVDFMVTDRKDVLLSTESMPEKDYYGRNTGAYYANATKRHAAEHNVPIVLIEREYYPKTAEDYAQNLGKLLDIMSPEELFDKMPDDKGKILQEFLDSDNLGVWDYMKEDGAKERLEELVGFSGDDTVKKLFDDFLVLNGY